MKTIFTSLFVLCYTALFAQAGALDPSFAIKGQFVSTNQLSLHYKSAVTAIAVQPNGKIIMAGYGNTYVADDAEDFEIFRLNTNGTLDNSFGNAGRVFIDFTKPGELLPSNDKVTNIALQPDGKIIVAGNINIYFNNYIDSIQTYNTYDIGIVRLNPNGSLDATFNKTGKKIIDLSGSKYGLGSGTSADLCSGVVLRDNGKIVLGGYTYNNNNKIQAYPFGNNDPLLIQLKKNGSFDSSYNGNGVKIFVRKSSDDQINDVALQEDGKIVLTGSTNSDNISTNQLVMRTLPSGAIDKTFNATGYSIIDVGSGTSDFGTTVNILQGGKIIVGGYYYNQDNNASSYLIRYKANGKIDNTFGTNGKTIVAGDVYNTANAVSIQKDNKIIQSTEGFTVRRYLSNGKLDSSFGTYGKSKAFITLPPASYFGTQSSYANALQLDGKILVTGTTSFGLDRYTYGNTDAAVRMLAAGRNYGVTAPNDTTINLTSGCTVSLQNIDPILYPDTSFSIVKYYLYKSPSSNPDIPYDSGYGSASGKQFDINATTRVTYISTIDPLQRDSFTVTVTGGVPATALDFDGVDDRVDLNLPFYSRIPGVNHTYSIETWINVRAYNKNGGSVLLGNQRGNDSGIVISIDPNGYIATYQPNVGTVKSTYKIPLNTWTHIAVVQSISKLDLFVNGVFKQTLLQARNLQGETGNPFYIGASTNDGTTFSHNFNGIIDNMRIWNIALCQGEIQRNMTCEVTSAVGLLTELTFNQSSSIAGCKNTGLNGGGTLHNFYLDGPTSNWVKGSGFINGICTSFSNLVITTTSHYLSFPSAKGICGAYPNFSITATSDCYNSVQYTYTKNPGTFFPVGDNYIYAYATDALGNKDSISLDIYVFDSEAPTLVTKDTTIKLDENGFAALDAKSVTDSLYDNCTQRNFINLNVSPNTFYSNNVGVNTVEVKATDARGNITTKTATVTVLPYGSKVNNAFIATDNKASLRNDFKVMISPNPAQDYFTLQVTSNNLTDKINIRITDISGKVLDVISNVNAGELKHFGSQYKAGIYIANITQGTNHKTIKIVKM